ncbi:arsenate reductase (glutaredoxin) [Rapidithrix thailandica]|uniref:Arsenate reductase (Glutaredoxin) n=1 Tax=Rapidithrix thailandica TaxID=413964 RepID=A0AAW9S3U6_9BACT
MKIYHNPRCSKSRQALNILQEKGIELEVVEYLKTPPTKEELTQVLKKLNLSPQEIIRKGEAEFKEHYKGKEFTDEEWIEILVNTPRLIERPIVITEQKAVVARPPEKVSELL